uniref:Protein farnesyltransferase subunit beta n=1 Tax=Anthurium amnicola TaxID=1678845 RepID=A0A1D1Z4B7_9ARAE
MKASSAPSTGTGDGSPPPSSSAPPQRKLTVTQRDQLNVEGRVFEILQSMNGASPEAQSVMLELWRDKHIEFLAKGLRQLGPSYCVLDANRPWLCYWILHSLALLGESIDLDLEDNVVDFLSRCQDDEGGYGGGPGQLPHLATTYAAVSSLITLGSERALSSINRHKMRLFLLRMKDLSGAFRMHDEGEIDVRACYTAISVASSLNILDDEFMKDLGNYILSCQTYEGGIAGEPGSEAHGGYTFCGLATMILIGEADKLDLPSLIDWVTFRQGVECGFQGRTNKLVDGCYSFWQGGVLALIQRILSIVNEQLKSSFLEEGKETVESNCSTSSSHLSGEESDLDEHPCEADKTFNKSTEGQFSNIDFNFLERESGWGPLFHSIALQHYILLCCQVLEGGFRDKPGKHRDHYHSCYCLSGLSLCQYSWSKNVNGPPLPNTVLGPYSNLLEPIHPLHNVILDKYYKVHEFFSKS